MASNKDNDGRKERGKDDIGKDVGKDMGKNVVFGKYKLVAKVGAGAFGKIYSGFDIESGDPVAVKFEIPKPNCKRQLVKEYQIYQSMSGSLSINKRPWPKAYQIGQTKTGSLLMVMELLGKSLDALVRPVTPAALAYIALNVLHSLQCFHEKGFVHRDIKLGNLLLTRNSLFPDVVLVDYGLATKVKAADHYADGKGLKGTVRYTSINTHLGVQQNIRDDLQSFGYVLLQLAGADIPWFEVRKSSDKQRSYYSITKEKLRLNAYQCTRPLHASIRDQVCEYILYVNSLSFHGKPNYAYLLGFFRPLAQTFNGKLFL
jgi:casein kinase I homolog HRR25